MSVADDDYAYLEQQLDPGAKVTAPVPRDGDESRRERSREGRRGKEDRRGKDRSRSRDRSERKSDRDRDADRPRDRDRGRDSYGRGSDRQDYERRGRGHERERDNDRGERNYQRGGGGRGYGAGGGGGGGGYGRKREQTPPEVRAAREQEKELKEMERATRTLFASNVNLRADEKDVFMFFSQAGTVQDVQLIKDRNKKFKGFVYVEMSKPDEVFKGLQLSGQLLLGQPVWVKSSEHERNLQWELEHARAAQLAEQQQQMAAMPQLGGLPLDMGAMAGLDMGTMDPAAFIAQYGASLSGLAPAGTAGFPGLPGSTLPGQDPHGGPPQDLDDMEDNKGGMKLSAATRMALMNRLASSAGLQVAPSVPAGGQTGMPHAGVAHAPPVDSSLALQQGMLGPSSPIPTQYMLLKNMFSAEEEAANGEGWDKEIANDVAEECSKYGQVLHCHVDKNSQGHVYLKFVSVEAAAAAQHALSGRWFAGRQIAAEFQFAHAYLQVFGV